MLSFTFNPFCFQSYKSGCVRCQCIMHMLLKLLGGLLKEIRVFVLKRIYIPPEPTVNIHIY